MSVCINTYKHVFFKRKIVFVIGLSLFLLAIARNYCKKIKLISTPYFVANNVASVACHTATLCSHKCCIWHEIYCTPQYCMQFHYGNEALLLQFMNFFMTLFSLKYNKNVKSFN